LHRARRLIRTAGLFHARVLTTRNGRRFALVGANVGEFLGAREGTGLLIGTVQSSFASSGLFAAIIVIAVLALIAERLPINDRGPVADLAPRDYRQRMTAEIVS
jgi:hypothetical protein